MRRPVAWTEKTPEGKKEYRVALTADSVRWQVKAPGAERWEYDIVPTEEEWSDLEQKVRNLLQRGHCYQNELAIVVARGKKVGK